jgi:hypothetical protein
MAAKYVGRYGKGNIISDATAGDGHSFAGKHEKDRKADRRMG